MKSDEFFGPVKLKDKDGREFCYQRMSSGEWLEREAKSYVWREISEIPELLGVVVQGLLN
jgi:hypothetical protein